MVCVALTSAVLGTTSMFNLPVNLLGAVLLTEPAVLACHMLCRSGTGMQTCTLLTALHPEVCTSAFSSRPTTPPTMIRGYEQQLLLVAKSCQQFNKCQAKRSTWFGNQTLYAMLAPWSLVVLALLASDRSPQPTQGAREPLATPYKIGHCSLQRAVSQCKKWPCAIGAVAAAQHVSIPLGMPQTGDASTERTNNNCWWQQCIYTGSAPVLMHICRA